MYLEYVLNFLGNQGRQRYNHWQPTGADAEAQKKSASAFLDHLQSTMDHDISIHCRIYQLEETRILPGETPDELVDCLQTLADCCNFPTDDEKEWNVQYQLVCALDNSELVKKLLTLPIKETTAKMLEVCRTHNAINSEMEALGLGSSKTVHAIHKDPSRKVNARDTNLNNSSIDNNTPVGTAQNSMPWDKLPSLQRTPSAKHVAKWDTGRPSVR